MSRTEKRVPCDAVLYLGFGASVSCDCGKGHKRPHHAIQRSRRDAEDSAGTPYIVEESHEYSWVTPSEDT